MKRCPLGAGALQVLRTLLTENIQQSFWGLMDLRKTVWILYLTGIMWLSFKRPFHSYDASKPFFRRDNSLEFQ